MVASSRQRRRWRPKRNGNEEEKEQSAADTLSIETNKPKNGFPFKGDAAAKIEKNRFPLSSWLVVPSSIPTFLTPPTGCNNFAKVLLCCSTFLQFIILIIALLLDFVAHLFHSALCLSQVSILSISLLTFTCRGKFLEKQKSERKIENFFVFARNKLILQFSFGFQWTRSLGSWINDHEVAKKTWIYSWSWARRWRTILKY